MRKLGWFLALASLALAGCGGGDNSFGGGSSGGSSGGTNVATVTVSASGASIPADGSASVTITALVRDASNVALSNQLVTFSSSAGSLVVNQATTDGSGNATATLSAGGAAAGTAITVTASTGGVQNTVTVNVVNTQQTITLSTDLPQIPSDSSRSAVITALVRDANNQVISGVPVNFSSTSGGLTVTGGTTDANGLATATLNAATDPTNRTITVTASAGAAQATINVDVIGTKLTVTGPANLVQNTQGTYTVSLTDSGGKGISGRTVTLTSSAGNTLSAASVVTDATGQKTFQLTAVNGGNDTITAGALGLQATHGVVVSTQSFAFTAPTANAKVDIVPSPVPPGPYTDVTVHWTSNGAPQAGQVVTFTSTRGTLTASTANTNASGDATVQIYSTQSGPAVITASGTGVTAQITIDFVAKNPASVVLQASPSTVAIQGQSTLTAIVRDASNNLVEGVIVDFALSDITGGTLSVASATTDNQGRATTVYTASSTTSSKDGVVVTASTGGATPGTARITVAGQTLFLSLGTGNTINIENAAQYSIDYAVQAIDTAGNAVANANITMTVVSLDYIKGGRAWNGTIWAVVPSTQCSSEDVNANGILDSGEDFNTNSKLDPGLVASVSPGSVTTDSAGNALVKVTYPKDHADYVQVRLTATTTVQGTEASTTATFWLPVAAPDVNKQNVGPPGPVSPYGVAADCANPN